MLHFNPHFRPSAKELLQNSIFDGIRHKINEADADYGIILSIDLGEQQADYNDETE